MPGTPYFTLTAADVGSDLSRPGRPDLFNRGGVRRYRRRLRGLSFSNAVKRIPDPGFRRHAEYDRTKSKRGRGADVYGRHRQGPGCGELPRAGDLSASLADAILVAAGPRAEVAERQGLLDAGHRRDGRMPNGRAFRGWRGAGRDLFEHR